jgi:hypothetical protein
VQRPGERGAPGERCGGGECKKVAAVHVSCYARTTLRSPSLPLHRG